MTIEDYHKINDSFSRNLIFKIGLNSGFFSEYNNMILAMVYCLENHIRFNLSSLGANFNVKRGWNGYFLPFCEDVKDNNQHYRTLDWKYALKILLKRYDPIALRSFYPYLNRWKQNLLTQDVFGKCRDKARYKKIFVIPELNFSGDIQCLCSILVNMTWRYNLPTQQRIDQIIQNLSLPDKYVSIHVRRGDKIAESNYYSLENYLNLLGTSNKNLFVATDDYSVIEDIHKEYPQWNIKTLCSPEERGYIQSQADQESWKEKDQSMIILFATMEIINNSEKFVGTYSSNMGMFQGMRNPTICTGVDFDHWVIW